MKNLFYTSPKYLQNLKGLDSSASEIDSSADIFSKNTIVLFGDSLIQNNGPSPLNTTSLNITTAAHFRWANAMMGMPFDIIKNSGIGGNTSLDMLNRIETDVLAYSPNYVFMGMTTNDLTPLNRTFDEITDTYTTIFTILKRNGIKVIISNMVSHYSFFNHPNSGDLIKMFFKLNKWLASYALANDNIIMIDLCSVGINQTLGTPITDWTDGIVHPKGVLAIKMGKKIAEALNNSIKKVNRLPISNIDPDNININGMMMGDNNGLASSYELSLGTNVVAVLSKEKRENDNIGEFQCIDISVKGTGRSSFRTLSYLHNLSSTDKVFLVWEIDASEVTELEHVYLNLHTQNKSYVTIDTSYFMYSNAEETPLGTPFTAVFMTTPLLVGEATRVRGQVTFSGLGKFKIGRCGIYKA